MKFKLQGYSVQWEDRQWVMWLSNSHKVPGNLCATWDPSYQPPLWVDTSAAWIFNNDAGQVADYWWIINPCRSSWISPESFGESETLSQEQVCVSFGFMTQVYDKKSTLSVSVWWCFCSSDAQFGVIMLLCFIFTTWGCTLFLQNKVFSINLLERTGSKFSVDAHLRLHDKTLLYQIPLQSFITVETQPCRNMSCHVWATGGPFSALCWCRWAHVILNATQSWIFVNKIVVLMH